MAIIRINSNDYEAGEAYLARLGDETTKNFAILRSLLSSYFKSVVDGPSYARNLKAIAITLSQIRLSLDDIYNDIQYTATRTEFLYQVVTNLVFPKESPDLGTGDIEFREFLTNVIKCYFKGATPSSIEEGLKLLTSDQTKVIESFSSSRNYGSEYDISDSFSFSIDILLANEQSYNTAVLDRNIRILLATLRPAHTLYKIKFILQDSYVGNSTLPITGQPYEASKVLDTFTSEYSDAKYDDFRKFVLGIKDVDVDGFKTPITVVDETYSP